MWRGVPLASTNVWRLARPAAMLLAVMAAAPVSRPRPGCGLAARETSKRQGPATRSHVQFAAAAAIRHLEEHAHAAGVVDHLETGGLIAGDAPQKTHATVDLHAGLSVAVVVVHAAGQTIVHLAHLLGSKR